jgi:hypothetical protein
MKCGTIGLSVLVLLCIGVTYAFGLEYSAEIVNRSPAGTVTGKIYVADEKVRMEMAGVTTISRADKKVVWVIMPEQGMYMEQPFDPEKMVGATEKMPGEVERIPLGSDTFDGKRVEKYRIVYTSSAGRAVVIQWIEPSSQIPLKTEAEDGSWSMEYHNLRLGRPDTSLFEVPGGMRKFVMPDVSDMMQTE